VEDTQRGDGSVRKLPKVAVSGPAAELFLIDNVPFDMLYDVDRPHSFSVIFRVPPPGCATRMYIIWLAPMEGHLQHHFHWGDEASVRLIFPDYDWMVAAMR